MEIERLRKRSWVYFIGGIVGTAAIIYFFFFTPKSWVEIGLMGACIIVTFLLLFRSKNLNMRYELARWRRRHASRLQRVARATNDWYGVGPFPKIGHEAEHPPCPNCQEEFAVHIQLRVPVKPPPGARDLGKTELRRVPCCLSCDYAKGDDRGLTQILAELEAVQHDPLPAINDRLDQIDGTMAKLVTERAELQKQKQRIEMEREPRGYREPPQLPASHRMDPFDPPLEGLRTSQADDPEENVFERIDRERRNA